MILAACAYSKHVRKKMFKPSSNGINQIHDSTCPCMPSPQPFVKLMTILFKGLLKGKAATRTPVRITAKIYVTVKVLVSTEKKMPTVFK